MYIRVKITSCETYAFFQQITQVSYLCPPNPKGGRKYCFWCRSRRRPRSYFSVHYLLNGMMDFDQTFIDTQLEGGRVDQILVTLTLRSRSQRHLKMSEIWFPCVIFWTRGWILTKLAYIHFWEDGKSTSNFGDLDLDFQGHIGTLKCPK